MRKLLLELAAAPASQADPSICARCAQLANEPYTADDVKAILDDIVESSLASDFFVMALDVVWREAGGRP